VNDVLLNLMRHEFDTALVVDIDGHDLYRLRRYIETVREKGVGHPAHHPKRRPR
jgi:hypothetical protein